MANSLFLFWYAQGMFAEGLRWSEKTPRDWQDQDVGCLRVQGGLYTAMGNLEQARTILLRALTLTRQFAQPLTIEELRLQGRVCLHLAPRAGAGYGGAALP
ncbi:hypothetical protein [Deinococcus aerophilus]|uniref:MalT-like TPR region domain-containing protein n=1 Tax=Deinococcus aerophilus TaxID=522488 RepID=A0ABQ2H0B3_9DEIO|nr:hypothetical protein [Deinococcus aerophilus]GGM20838.1 hypothetical protein GCM10010841_31090 [Deinococcus aerophilus]